MTTKNQKLKMALTSTPMILIYVMVVFCLIAAIRQPAFLSPATAINLARAGIFTMCFAICEMVVIISGGIDVSFPAVGCVAMYVPLYMNYHDMGPDNLFFFFGLAMFIGFSPDFFNPTLIGSWLDKYPGAPGYQMVFAYMLGTMVVGLVFVVLLMRHNKKNAGKLQAEQDAAQT